MPFNTIFVLGTTMYELELSLEKILQIISQITETHFFHIKEIC